MCGPRPAVCNASAKRVCRMAYSRALIAPASSSTKVDRVAAVTRSGKSGTHAPLRLCRMRGQLLGAPCAKAISAPLPR